MSIQNPNRDLADYLHRRLEFLGPCHAEIETKALDDERDLIRRIDSGEYGKSDPAVGKIVFHLENVVRNTFRYTMLVGVCSFLEVALKAIAQRSVSDYGARLKRKKSGNWLQKHVSVLSDAIALDVVSIQADFDKFNHLICIRNCIVHAWGNLAEDSNAAAVRNATQRIETADVSHDDHVVLGDQVIPEALNAAETIAEHILTSKLNVSMT
jgi:hypothetical protein